MGKRIVRDIGRLFAEGRGEGKEGVEEARTKSFNCLPNAWTNAWDAHTTTYSTRGADGGGYVHALSFAVSICAAEGSAR